MQNMAEHRDAFTRICLDGTIEDVQIPSRVLVNAARHAVELAQAACENDIRRFLKACGDGDLGTVKRLHNYIMPVDDAICLAESKGMDHIVKWLCSIPKEDSPF